MKLRQIGLLFCGCVWFGLLACRPTTQNASDNCDLAYADSMFTHILEKYNVEKYGLLLETYPPNPKNQVTYLTEGSEQKAKEIEQPGQQDQNARRQSRIRQITGCSIGP